MTILSPSGFIASSGIRKKSSRLRDPVAVLSRAVNRLYRRSIWLAVNPVSFCISANSSSLNRREGLLPIFRYVLNVRPREKRLRVRDGFHTSDFLFSFPQTTSSSVTEDLYFMNMHTRTKKKLMQQHVPDLSDCVIYYYYVSFLVYKVIRSQLIS